MFLICLQVLMAFYCTLNLPHRLIRPCLTLAFFSMSFMPSPIHYVSATLISFLFLNHLKLFSTPRNFIYAFTSPLNELFLPVFFLYLKTTPKSHLVREFFSDHLKEFPLSMTLIVLYHYTLYIS